MPSIAIVGYTNAGKSSLLNALTGAGVLVQDALFATLEPTTRRGQFDDGRAFTVSDTVGFVRHLPTQLVEAFRSTLEEVVDADLLVHVVDGSDVNPLAQISAVRQVISEVFADHDSGPAPELIVVNKTDAAGDLGLAKLRRALPGALFVSARTGDGIDALRRRMAELAAPTDTAVDVVIPYDRGDLVARVHAEAGCSRPSTTATAPGSKRGSRWRWPQACAHSRRPEKGSQTTESAGAPAPGASACYAVTALRQEAASRRLRRPVRRRGAGWASLGPATTRGRAATRRVLPP